MPCHWFLLPRLCGTTKVLTKPGVARSGGAPNVLWPLQLGTDTSLLSAGHTVDDTCSVTGGATFDGVGLPSEVAGVHCGVTGVGAHTTVSSFATLVEALSGLPPSLSVLGWGDLGSD